MKNPCKPDCPDRTATCHSTCKNYKKFEHYNMLRRELIHKKKMTKISLNNYEFENSGKRY